MSGRSRRQRSARISPTDPPSGVEETTSLEPVQAWMKDPKLVQTSTSQAHLLNYITLVGLKTRGNETSTSQTVDTAEQSIFKNKPTRPQHKQDQGQPRQTRVQTGVHACSMTQWYYLGLPARADRVSCYRTRSQAGLLPCVYPPHTHLGWDSGRAA